MLSGQGKNEALLGGKGALAGIELCEPFGDNERAGVARCWIPWGSAAKKTAYQGWGEDPPVDPGVAAANPIESARTTR